MQLIFFFNNDTTLVFPHYKLTTSQAADYFCILVGYFENTVKHFSLVKTFFIMLLVAVILIAIHVVTFFVQFCSAAPPFFLL